jgi:phosphoserine phosphatase
MTRALGTSGEGRVSRAGEVPLCIDLDGTLIRTDTLFVSVRALARIDPMSFARMPFWLVAGRARLKAEIAGRVSIDAGRLPYNRELIELLWREREAGRRLWLVTAADRRVADAVVAHLGLFAGVLASDGSRNLKGAAKLRALEELFPRGFDYAGNSAADLPIWRRARRAIVVNAPRAVVRAARAHARVHLVIP